MSVTVITTLYVPVDPVGVPVISLLPLAMVRPGGSEDPGAAAQLQETPVVSTPPVALRGKKERVSNFHWRQRPNGPNSTQTLT